MARYLTPLPRYLTQVGVAAAARSVIRRPPRLSFRGVGLKRLKFDGLRRWSASPNPQGVVSKPKGCV